MSWVIQVLIKGRRNNGKGRDLVVQGERIGGIWSARFFNVVALMVLLLPLNTYADDNLSTLPVYTKDDLPPLPVYTEDDLPSFELEDLQSEFEFRTEESVMPESEDELPRPVEDAAGPRILIQHIRFERLPEFPDAGITREVVESLVESRRQALMLKDRQTESGFTTEELDVVEAWLKRFSVSGDDVAHLNGDNANELTRLVRLQRSKRGLSYGDIETIAGEVTAFYRSKGFFLARAYVPAQDVVDGVISLTIFEGRLGKILADSSAFETGGFNQRLVTSSINKLVGQAVDGAAVEEEIYLLNDFAGISALGYFSQGDALGETNLKIRIRDEKKWALFSRADNHGTNFSGNRRLYTVFEWLSPLGRGDSASLGYLKSTTFDSDINIGDADVGVFSYRMPLTPRTGVKVSAEYNQFTVNPDGDPLLERMDLGGVNQSGAVGVWHKWLRSRTRNVSLGAALTSKQTKINSILELPAANQDHARGLELSVQTDFLNESPKMLNNVNVQMQYSDLVSEVTDGRSTDHYVFRVDTSSLLLFPMPSIAVDARLLFHSKWQYSESSLPGFELSSLGGVSAVRAYTTADFSADKSAFASVEWFVPFAERFNADIFGQKLNNLLQWGLFYDYGYGEKNTFEKGIENTKVTLSGGGLLFKLTWRDQFTSQISFSYPGLSRTENDIAGSLEIDDDSVRTYIDFSYRI